MSVWSDAGEAAPLMAPSLRYGEIKMEAFLYSVTLSYKK